tara:strand:+ start:1086 stop:1676 length:591 start_codon:yes stop_codon:yes gene_type:complete
MIHVDPPFDLGETLKGTDDDGNQINSQWEGAVFEFPDVDRTPSPRGGGKNRRSGGTLRAVCVRNIKDGALTVATATYGLVLGFGTTASGTGRKAAGQVAGASLTEGDWAGVGDPELGTTTVAKHDLFWLIIGGAVPVFAEGAGSPIGVGNAVVADAGTDGHVILADASNVVGQILGITLDDIADNAAGLVHLCVNY